MANASNYLESYFLSHLLGSGTFSKPSVIAVALCRNVPDDSMTGATIPEVANAGAYARQTINPSETNWLDPVAADGTTHNKVAITFPTATADWGWVSGVVLASSATHGAGQVYVHAALTTPKLVGSGDTFSFASGALPVTMS